MIQTDEVEAVRAEVEAGLADVCGQLNVAHARLVELVRRAIETTCWEGIGILSCEQWVAWQTGLSPARAHDVVALARRQVELPALFEAFGDGELSIDQVTVVARHVPPTFEADATELARNATVSQLRRSLRHHHFGDEAASPDRGEPCGLSAGFQHDGRYRLRALLDAADGAIVDQALSEARDALFQAGDERVVSSDALVEIARRSLDRVVSPGRAERFTALVHVSLDGDTYLHDGPALPDHLRRQVLCDAAGVIVGLRGGRPVAAGRATRIVPDRLRRLLEDRDRGCRVPGCTSRRVQIHHLVHWEDGGRTDPENLLALCPRHHRSLHRGLLRVSGNPELAGDVSFRDRWGRLLPGTQRARPPSPGGLPAVPGRWAHPTGERLSTWWLTLNPSRPPDPVLRC